MKLDPNTFAGTPLGDYLQDHERLVADLAQAKVNAEAADAAVKEAKEHDINADVLAALTKEKPKGGPTADKAQKAAQAASRALYVAERAVLASQDRICDECRQPQYAATLKEREQSIVGVALNALSVLEEHLGEISNVRA